MPTINPPATPPLLLFCFAPFDLFVDLFDLLPHSVVFIDLSAYEDVILLLFN